MADNSYSLLVFSEPVRAERAKRFGAAVPAAPGRHGQATPHYAAGIALKSYNAQMNLGVEWLKQQLRVTRAASFVWMVEGRWVSIRLAF